MLDRRRLMLATGASVAGAVAAGTTLAANSIPTGPSLPAREWNNENPTVPYPDANIQVLDPRFKRYLAGTTLLRRVWTGAEWTEGPVWFGDMHCNPRPARAAGQLRARGTARHPHRVRREDHRAGG
jgi:hypothetical protein